MSTSTTTSTVSMLTVQSPGTNRPLELVSPVGTEFFVNNSKMLPIAAKRRFSCPTLYEVRRRHSGDVCYFFVPDEYELIQSQVMLAAREELDFLKDTITTLAKRLKLLELENRIFKRYAPPELLEIVHDHMKNNYKGKYRPPGQLELTNGEIGIALEVSPSYKNESADGPIAAAVVAISQNPEGSSGEGAENNSNSM